MRRPGTRAGAVGVALGAYAGAAALATALALATYGFFAVTDIGYYWTVSDQIAMGLRLYRDFPLEYPPIAAWFFMLPRVAGEHYGAAFAVLAYVMGAVLAAWIGFVAPGVWSGREQRRPGLFFALSVVACGVLIANRFDVLVALEVGGALLALMTGHGTIAAGLLGVGFATKLTPAVLLPLVVLVAHRRARAVLAFGLAALLPFAPYLDAPLLSRLWLFHAERPLQFESLAATPYLVGHLLSVVPVAIVTDHGSQAVVAPGAAAVAAACLPLQGIAVAGAYALAWLRREALKAEHLALAAAAVVSSFVLFGKVLSPQYLIWLAPLYALAAPGHRRLALGFVGCAALTQLLFPAYFKPLIALDPVAVLVAAVRNGALLALWGATLTALWRLRAPGLRAEPRRQG